MSSSDAKYNVPHIVCSLNNLWLKRVTQAERKGKKVRCNFKKWLLNSYSIFNSIVSFSQKRHLIYLVHILCRLAPVRTCHGTVDFSSPLTFLEEPFPCEAILCLLWGHPACSRWTQGPLSSVSMYLCPMQFLFTEYGLILRHTAEQENMAKQTRLTSMMILYSGFLSPLSAGQHSEADRQEIPETASGSEFYMHYTLSCLYFICDKV